jgi:hypothetical protein
MAMLSFAGGGVSLVYSGYYRFDSDELHGWIGESGQPKTASHGSTHRALAAMRKGDKARAPLQSTGMAATAHGNGSRGGTSISGILAC